MTVIGERAEDNRLRTEAVEWVQLLDSGHVTLADIEALKAWRCRSAAHEEGFIEARRLWGDMAAANASHERERRNRVISSPAGENALSVKSADGPEGGVSRLQPLLPASVRPSGLR